MRRSFLHPNPDRFTDEQKTAVLALARAQGGTCLTDVMNALSLGRTAAISLLLQLTDAQLLYSVPNPARRHLRYHVDEFDITPELLQPDIEPRLLAALTSGPATAAQLAQRLTLPVEVAHANLEHLRKRGVVFGPRGAGPRLYHPAHAPDPAVKDGPAA